MKTTKLLLAIALLIITSTFAQKSNFEKDLEMYTQVWDNIINKRQIEQINNTYFDENVVLVTSPENSVGIAGMKAYYQNYLTGFSDITFTVQNVFGQGDQLVKHWNFKGKHTGNFFGIPPTGKNIDVQGVTLVKMKDGKIAQEEDFMDNTVLMQQLGLTSNPENVGVIDGLYKAFSAGDIPGALAFMDPKIVWNEAESNYLSDGNPYVGPDAVLNGVFARLGADHEYFKLTDIELQEMTNNKVLATLRYDAKVKKTGKTYNAQVAHLWTLNDRKIIAFQQYADTEKLAEAEE
jgi:hypothetical protein